jgi:hypothetical protein
MSEEQILVLTVNGNEYRLLFSRNGNIRIISGSRMITIDPEYANLIKAMTQEINDLRHQVSSLAQTIQEIGS